MMHKLAKILGIAGVLALSGLSVQGCGTNAVEMRVDVLSFVAPEEQAGDYFAPGGAVLEPEAIEPQRIELLEGMGELVSMERVEITFAIDFIGDPSSGAGEVETRFYFADPDQGSGGSEVYQTAPVWTGMSPLGTSTSSLTGVIEATDANGLLALFENGALIMGVAMVYDASGSITPVAGAWSIEAIDATVFGRGSAF